jgi:hypothetical protein
MEDRVAEVTVRVVLCETAPEVAVMVVVPAVRAVARPLLLTTATEVSDELQVTNLVISPPGATGNVPVAVNCWVVPTGMIGLSGVTLMEVGCSIPSPHEFKDIAKKPRIDILRMNLKFFIRHPTGKKPAIPAWRLPQEISLPASKDSLVIHYPFSYHGLFLRSMSNIFAGCPFHSLDSS